MAHHGDAKFMRLGLEGVSDCENGVGAQFSVLFLLFFLFITCWRLGAYIHDT